MLLYRLYNINIISCLRYQTSIHVISQKYIMASRKAQKKKTQWYSFIISILYMLYSDIMTYLTWINTFIHIVVEYSVPDCTTFIRNLRIYLFCKWHHINNEKGRFAPLCHINIFPVLYTHERVMLHIDINSYIESWIVLRWHIYASLSITHIHNRDKKNCVCFFQLENKSSLLCIFVYCM